ncbi:MAG: hypothetical protein JXO72_13270 [Vicinamibacteria bacterium]|nr:hypothetical protein [Vicinamibacteria bacterium]
MHDSRSRLFGSGLITGLFLLLIGVLLILEGLGYISIGRIHRLWPALIIAIGLGRILGRVSFGMRLEGAFWLLAGCVLLASTLMLIPISVWPLLFIFAGLLIIGRAAYGHERRGGSTEATESSNQS